MVCAILFCVDGTEAVGIERNERNERNETMCNFSLRNAKKTFDKVDAICKHYEQDGNEIEPIMGWGLINRLKLSGLCLMNVAVTSEM